MSYYRLHLPIRWGGFLFDVVIKAQSGEISDILEPLVKECVPIREEWKIKMGKIGWRLMSYWKMFPDTEAFVDATEQEDTPRPEDKQEKKRFPILVKRKDTP